MNVCQPSDPVPFGPHSDVPPQFGGFFSSRDGEMDIDVAGATLTSEYELAMHFALADCDGGGIDGGTCFLVVSGFDLDLHDIEVSGGASDYSVSSEIRLDRTAIAEVFFDECGVSECAGTFEFSAAEENPLHLNLEWTQVNTSTLSTGHGALHIANDGEALGGVDILYGSINVDPLGQYGLINMSGIGEDALGGDFASAEFNLVGFVETIDTDPGDCCATGSSPGGCTNKYITACVATHEPECYSTEWDSSCVLGVEAHGCGTCP